MENLKIQLTHNTPEVIFDIASEKLSIKGICAPENPKYFFDPVIDKLNEFLNKHQKLVIDVYLEYFNSGTSNCLLNILEIASSSISNKADLKIIWTSEDIDLKESGLTLSEISGLEFEYVDLDEE
jgi:hypothetical protein